ncbi:MAG: class I SAM-dependent methyltransferase [Sphingomonadales bacterium]|nr:class I SAM-dependent methyltransferase [Sphingomonadales bacterium]PIX67166.1 MAG: hypothetical protein COZ43_02870 [Sphingomonadales bacterium CG_4_10_14_3_um_filter_58_15]NCO48893.1 class I SAM-dependent methyltransferase [Sphingomonadales bacterium]NCO99348.1 class I SAM-dependent methyltransferase [Sphingomonadales bacterium]NCP26973.1 class I SAM-dependent methyltransferase [Sphingomonadales bacterium]
MPTEQTESVALHSGEYVERYNRKPLDRVRALASRIDLAEDDELADFACGNGMLLQVVGDRIGTYHGVDFSNDFIASARDWARSKGLNNCQFYCDDIIKFCADHPAQFDVATTLDFSEHIDDALAVSIYSAIRSSLRPGGKLYLHTPNLDFFMERAKDMGVLRQFPEHIAVRNGNAIKDILIHSGFDASKIEVDTIAHYNILKVLHPFSRLPLVGKYFEARLWIKASV